MASLSLDNCRQVFDDRVLLRRISMQLAEGERVGLLGPNACGKSTLMRNLAGLEPLDERTRPARRARRAAPGAP